MFVRVTPALTVNTENIGFVEDVSTTDDATGEVTAQTKLTMNGGGSTIVPLAKSTVEAIFLMDPA